jgi:regulator of protease activity HflC (stomatin/prohibitin superfamily)
MVASTGDFRNLLSGALWFAGSAAMVAIFYAVSAGSSIATALGFQSALVALTVWAAGNLHRKRDLASPEADSPLSANSDGTEMVRRTDPLRSTMQTHATVLGGASAILGLFALLQLLQLNATDIQESDDKATFGIVCLAVGFVWLVLARLFQSIRVTELPEAQPLKSVFREAQWYSLIAAASLIGSVVEPLLVFWAARLLLIWIFVICAETLLRLLASVLIPPDPTQAAVSPIHLVAREAIFTASNPITSLIRTFEDRCGVSLRSSWASAFVKNSVLPLLIFLMLLSWSLTSLAIVETHQMAVREHFGRSAGGPLLPGLHLMLPWPFGRIRSFPVKTVQQLPIGFVEADEVMNRDQPRALLWTKPHAKEEFALALGNGSELVAVNAVVYFKISEDRQEFLDYVYQQSAPEEALIAFAYRALMEETRGRTLDDVLSVNRAAFARRIANSVREQTKDARLGLEVVDFAVLNLHPPIEAGSGFLEVINARLNARRRVIEAEGEKQVALLDAETRGAMAVSSAKIEGSRRVAGALSEVSEFKAVGHALQVSPGTFRLRLWIEALENALSHQRLFLVDRTLLDEGGELMLDTRQQQNMRLPNLDAPSPHPLPGPNQND